MGDELQRQALARDITRRLQIASFDELRAIDQALIALEQCRAGIAGGRWERRLPTGPGDVDRLFHLATPRPGRGVVETACNGSWRFGDVVEMQDNPALTERCPACWRALADHPLAVWLIVVVEELAEQDIARAGLREEARAEMLGCVPTCTGLITAARQRLDERRDRAVAEAIAARPDLYMLEPTITAIGLPSIMDANAVTKARALDSLEQESRRLTIESEREFADDQHETKVSARIALDEAPAYESVEVDLEELGGEGG